MLMLRDVDADKEKKTVDVNFLVQLWSSKLDYLSQHHLIQQMTYNDTMVMVMMMTAQRLIRMFSNGQD